VPKIYSAVFRNEMIRKLNSPRGPSVLELAAKTGVHQTTLSRWVREGTTVRAAMSQDDDDKASTRPRAARRPQDFSPEEKLRIVQQAGQLEGSALGAFLRREGLHEADLAEWRELASEAALAALAGRRQRTTEQKRVRKLESELRRKEKALAEAAALLVLAKKARALWPDEDDDTTGSDDE
jgi:transposase